jgi:hypothetical protein
VVIRQRGFGNRAGIIVVGRLIERLLMIRSQILQALVMMHSCAKSIYEEGKRVLFSLSPFVGYRLATKGKLPATRGVWVIIG